ncbi:MAG: acyl-CoA thioesterase [Bacteroidetes bacterium]|nr:MAG: acyl-CoA thioesterase [Bacteroidota bacterium]
MLETSTQFRIHYALTDQMGFVYYGNYAQFFEIGRVEAIRSLGITYKTLEQMGVLLPVVDFTAKYIRPVTYDELITIKTTLREMPTGSKIIFYSDVFGEDGRISCRGTVALHFVDKITLKSMPMPAALQRLLEPHFTTAH